MAALIPAKGATPPTPRPAATSVGEEVATTYGLPAFDEAPAPAAPAKVAPPRAPTITPRAAPPGVGPAVVKGALTGPLKVASSQMLADAAKAPAPPAAPAAAAKPSTTGPRPAIASAAAATAAAAAAAAAAKAAISGARPAITPNAAKGPVTGPRPALPSAAAPTSAAKAQGPATGARPALPSPAASAAKGPVTGPRPAIALGDGAHPPAAPKPAAPAPAAPAKAIVPPAPPGAGATAKPAEAMDTSSHDAPPVVVPPAKRVPPGVEPDFAAQVEYWAARLDSIDYFEILKLLPQATAREIKKSYHRESRAYHPDRFFRLEDTEFRDAVDRIYKRINEAYVTLRDDQKRPRYAADVTGANRAQKLRFTDESEQEVKAAAKKEKEEELGKTPQGRKFFAEGMKAMEAGKPVDAHRAFKMALTYESGNAKFKEKFLEAEKALPKSDFKIR